MNIHDQASRSLWRVELCEEEEEVEVVEEEEAKLWPVGCSYSESWIYEASKDTDWPYRANSYRIFSKLNNIIHSFVRSLTNYFTKRSTPGAMKPSPNAGPGPSPSAILACIQLALILITIVSWPGFHGNWPYDRNIFRFISFQGRSNGLGKSWRHSTHRFAELHQP